MNLFPVGKFYNPHSERRGNAFPEAFGYQAGNHHDDPWGSTFYRPRTARRTQSSLEMDLCRGAAVGSRVQRKAARRRLRLPAAPAGFKKRRAHWRSTGEIRRSVCPHVACASAAILCRQTAPPIVLGDATPRRLSQPAPNTGPWPPSADTPCNCRTARVPEVLGLVRASSVGLLRCRCRFLYGTEGMSPSTSWTSGASVSSVNRLHVRLFCWLLPRYEACVTVVRRRMPRESFFYFARAAQARCFLHFKSSACARPLGPDRHQLWRESCVLRGGPATSGYNSLHGRHTVGCYRRGRPCLSCCDLLAQEILCPSRILGSALLRPRRPKPQSAAAESSVPRSTRFHTRPSPRRLTRSYEAKASSWRCGMRRRAEGSASHFLPLRIASE